MKVKINISKFLVTLLFFLIAMLSSAIGLKMGLNWTILRAVFQIGISVGLISLSMLVLGFIIAIIISSKKKSNPSKLRKKFADSFNFAEAHLKRFVAKIKLKNALFLAYYLFVCLIGCISFVCISLCFFVKPITIIFLPLIFVEVVPLRKAFEYLLKKDNMAFIDEGIKKDEFFDTYSFFETTVKRELGKKYKINLNFGTVQDLDLFLIGNTVLINLNAYSFMLFNEEELKALITREIRALKDKKCKQFVRVLKSRKFYLATANTSKVFSTYFSFVIGDSLMSFEFCKNALKRGLEKRKDELVKGTDFAKQYFIAYKKQCVIDRFFSDARSFITLKMCKDDGGLRDFVVAVYNIFLDLIPIYGKEWEREVENKIKATICDKLTYKEKIAVLNVSVGEIEYKNNCTYEQKTIYDKYNVEYHESTKRAYEPKMRAMDGYYREIDHYEQNPTEYDERLKLIGVAHAYYMTAQINKAEDVYKLILNSGDNTSEVYFDYGCFLLLAKKDKKGVEFVYKAMENENLVEEGLEVLGRYYIYSGDENGYKEFCDYKTKRLDQMVKDYDSKMLDVNASFEKTTLDGAILSEIIDRLSKDDNIEEIYCADSKTKSGEKIIVFAVSVRNKTKEAFLESYERVFSILDNDYGKYDTFLISLDAETNKNLINRIKKDKVHLIFKK